MSVWSYVSDVIEVDTFADSDAEAMFLAQTVIDYLPKIDGSVNRKDTSWADKLRINWTGYFLRAKNNEV